MFVTYYRNAGPRALTEGAVWYLRARQCARTLSRRYNVPLDTVAAIIAVTSQRVTWKYNLTCTVRALKGQEIRHLGQVVAKVAKLMDGQAPANVVSGQKIRAFWRAILGDRDAVVLDSWMMGAIGVKTLTPKQYEIVANNLRLEAKRAGVAPSTFQAVVWCALRNELARLPF